MLRLSPTSMGVFQACHRKYQYQYEQKLAPKGANVNLIFGEVYQYGLTRLYETKSVEIAKHDATAKWNSYGVIDEREIRTPEKLRELVTAYDKEFFGKEQWTDNGGEILLEYPLCEGAVFVGKQDRRGWYGKERTIQRAIQENKTTTNPRWFIPEPNNQLIGYLWLESKILGEPVRKIVVTIAEINKNSALGLIKPRIKSDPPRSVFTRDPIYVEDFLVEEFEQDAVEVAREINNCSCRKYWPKNAPGACGNFGGCEFKQLCLCSDEEKPLIIELQYEKKGGK